MSESTQMKMAKASNHDLERVQNFFEELQDLINADDPIDIADFTKANFPCSGSWQRVVHGYSVLIDNAADPGLTYLDWKPEIKNLFELEKRWDNAVNMYPHLADEEGF